LTECVALNATGALERSRLLTQATQIFFATSNTKAFNSAAAKDAFFQRWFGRYVALFPEAFLFALDGDGAAIGYVAGCFDSFSDAARLITGDSFYYIPAFCSALRDYPSHFHINVKPGYQGGGVGAQLTARFLKLCHEAGSPGVHVVTGAESRAVKFYEARGFKHLVPLPEPAPGLAVLARATVAP
jgi:GNAT superfamily N-acetyltransferase